jgi:hypothetical protein
MFVLLMRNTFSVNTTAQFQIELCLTDAFGGCKLGFLFLRRKCDGCTVSSPKKPKTCRIYVGTSRNNGLPSAQI